MRDIIFYLGADVSDFSVISAAFKQLAHPVELHFTISADDLIARATTSAAPSMVFAQLSPDHSAAIELLQHLKAHPAIRWVPVILIGGRTDEWSHEELMAAGAAALLKSPLHIDCIQRLFSAAGDPLLRDCDTRAFAATQLS